MAGWSSESTAGPGQNCGGSGCGLRMECTLVAAADSTTVDANQAGPSSATRTIATTLSLPVHFVAGAPIESQFVLDYGTGPGAGDEQAESVGTWQVTGLPPGVQALACDGTDVTPARRAAGDGSRSCSGSCRARLPSLSFRPCAIPGEDRALDLLVRGSAARQAHRVGRCLESGRVQAPRHHQEGRTR